MSTMTYSQPVTARENWNDNTAADQAKDIKAIKRVVMFFFWLVMVQFILVAVAVVGALVLAVGSSESSSEFEIPVHSAAYNACMPDPSTTFAQCVALDD